MPRPIIQRAATSDDLNFEIDPKALQEIMSDALPQADEERNGRQTIAGNYSPPKPAMSARRSSLFGGAMRVKAANESTKRQPAMTPSRMMSKPRVISSATKTPRARTGQHTGISDSIHLNFDDCPDFLVAAAASTLPTNKTPSKHNIHTTANKTPGRQLQTKSFSERLDKENNSPNANMLAMKSSLSGVRSSPSPKVHSDTAITAINRAALLIDLDDLAPSPKKAEAKFFPIVPVEIPPVAKAATSIFDLPEFAVSKPAPVSQARKTEFSLFSPVRSSMTATTTTNTIKTSMTPKPRTQRVQEPIEQLVDDLDSTFIIEPTALQRASTAPLTSALDFQTPVTTNLTIELVSHSASTATVVKLSSAPPTPLSAPTVSRTKIIQSAPQVVQEDSETSEVVKKGEHFTDRLKAIAQERQALLRLISRLQEEEDQLIADYVSSFRVKSKENVSKE